MLLGNWKNVVDIEANLNMAELELIVSAAREKEARHHRFMAALKGIDLDAGEQTAYDKVEEMKQRVEAQKQGKTTDQMEFDGLFRFQSE